jgi:hypothetical protein
MSLQVGGSAIDGRKRDSGGRSLPQGKPNGLPIRMPCRHLRVCSFLGRPGVNEMKRIKRIARAIIVLVCALALMAQVLPRMALQRQALRSCAVPIVNAAVCSCCVHQVKPDCCSSKSPDRTSVRSANPDCRCQLAPQTGGSLTGSMSAISPVHSPAVLKAGPELTPSFRRIVASGLVVSDSGPPRRMRVPPDAGRAPPIVSE